MLKDSTFAPRVLALLFVLLYLVAMCFDWNFDLSPESKQYQANYPDAIRSGLSVAYFVAKVVWIVGTMSGLYGAVKILRQKKGAFFYLAYSAPLFAVATFLLSPQSNYPNVEPTMVHLLWCAFASTWAALLALSWRSSGQPVEAVSNSSADPQR